MCLYNSKFLCLPPSRHLKRIANNLKVSSGITTIENITFLKTKYGNLKEKKCNLLIDEIYVKQSGSYKGNKFLGFASNSIDQAIQAFTFYFLILK